MIVFLILLFLALSLLLYALFAGADFGAGILELSLGTASRKSERRLISRAMAPVWEANHIWLILAVVIVFTGFPPVYTTACNMLFIPIMFVLFGIVARGCGFVLRYYDSEAGISAVYSAVFSASSLFCTFFLGVLAGAMTYGRLDPNAMSFWEAYVAPWANLHCIFTGLFACALFMFLAALYLSGETEEKASQVFFQRRAGMASLAMVIFGAVVFASDSGLIHEFIRNPISLSAFFVATLLLVQIWYALRFLESTKRMRLWTRVAGASVVGLVLLGWYAVVFPSAIVFTRGSLSFYEAAAPDVVLRYLLGALVVGLAVVVPALIYLMKIFKWEILEVE